MVDRRNKKVRWGVGASLAAFVAAVGVGVIVQRRGEPAPLLPPIRFAYQDRVADAVSIVALREGFFAREGLCVRPMRFDSGPACSEALFSAAADIGTMGDTTAVIAAQRKAPIKIVASHGGGEHRHRIMVRNDSTITNAAGLAGKTEPVLPVRGSRFPH